MSNEAGNDICDVIDMVGFGKLRQEASAALDEIVAKVLANETKGTLTLKLSVIPMSDTQFQIDGDLTVGVPKAAIGGRVVYPNCGKLQANDPRQPEMINKNNEVTV